MKLAGRNPSVRICPVPSDRGDILNRLLQVRGAHRIRVDANVLRQEARQSFEKTAPQLNVAILPYANQKRKAHHKADILFGVTVDKIGHEIKFSFPEKQHVSPACMKGV